MNVFDALSRHVNWAGQRFSVAASNVANVDTPGYRAKEVSQFDFELNSTASRLLRTDHSHLSVQGDGTQWDVDVTERATMDETHSGNNVSLEAEMRTIGESSRAISGDTALYKLFHRLTITAAKG